MPDRISRRQLLTTTALAAGGVALSGWTPFLVSRPELTHGVASGDVSGQGAIVWCRADRPCRVIVDVDTSPAFGDLRRFVGPDALEPTDLTSRVPIHGLRPGQDVFYRVTLVDLADLRTTSAPVTGHLRTPDRGGREDVTLLWSADTAGQGFGINPDDGGMRTYRAMLREEPDLFVHCGDSVYADDPIPALKILSDGSVWRNRTNAAVARPAGSLRDYRARHLYNREDAHLRRFARHVAHVMLWDDHEVWNNWYPTEAHPSVDAFEPGVPLRAAWGKRAFFEHNPVGVPLDSPHVWRRIAWGPLVDVIVLDMRCDRSSNLPDAARQRLLGPEQLAWACRTLSESKAVWKVVATSLPLGMVIGDGRGVDAAANGDGPARGRELEVGRLLRHIRDERVRNVVFLTGDVHYAAALHYHPERARFRDFDPFWEFAAGPLHAGTFGGDPLDDTFGPELVFRRSSWDGVATGAPWDGMQFYGRVHVDAGSRVMTVSFHDREGRRVWSREIEPWHE